MAGGSVNTLGGTYWDGKYGVWMLGHGDRVVREGGDWEHPSKNRAPVARFAPTNGGVWCQRIGGDLFVWGNVEFGCGNQAACERGGLEAPQQNQAPVAQFSRTNGRRWCQRVGGGPIRVRDSWVE